ncbi:uncharacterized protein DEA37_0012814 [Paragonimus westermani]|uniref:RRM domain-containing protein n=1 Tax=Paragonimus westermani TaxID=34504 RepID=A0A5J4N8J2_9TREM|nr:uncharacterized protein DEA37_0012814 [Paragonimus westermani]
MASRDDKYSVFVGNLPPNTIQAHFDHIFPDCKMTSVRLIRDKESDAFKGFAYVDFDDEESLQLALKTDGSIVQGYRLRVNLAQDRRGGRDFRRVKHCPFVRTEMPLSVTFPCTINKGKVNKKAIRYSVVTPEADDCSCQARVGDV